MPQERKKVLVFASGSAKAGASGVRTMLEQIKEHGYDLEICGIVTQHPNGGAVQCAKDYRLQYYVTSQAVDMRNAENPDVIEVYDDIMDTFMDFDPNEDFIMLSGWVFKLPEKYCGKNTLNIHPAPMKEGVDKGKCGLAVHQAVLDAGLTHTAVNIHWVGIQYDDPNNKIFEIKIPIPIEINTAKELQKYVGRIEHMVQSKALNSIIHNLPMPVFELPSYE
jgi:phosphoribosylglycinamide formyltransferase-1